MKIKAKDLCNLFGVELGEEFKFGDCNYKITEKGLVIASKTSNQGMDSLMPLNDILKKEIIRLQFSPKVGDKYYFVSGYIDSDIWNDSIIDHLHLRTGNAFRSEAECKANADRICKAIFGET